MLPRFCSSLFGGRAKDNLFSCQLVSFNPVSRVNAVSARAFFRSSNIKDGAYLGIVSQLSLQVRDNSSAASLCVVVDGLSASRASDAQSGLSLTHALNHSPYAAFHVDDSFLMELSAPSQALPFVPENHFTSI